MAQTQIAAQRPRFSVALQSANYQKLINDTLQDPQRRQRFIASISAAVATNPALQTCDPGTILSCALLGESLNLSPSPQLGQYYLVPFNDRKNNREVATFILGYKGYIQLALRSGQYSKLNVMAIKQGELIRYNPLTEEIEVKLIADELEREVAPTMGYYATFKYLNGFRKAMYWSKEKMEQHALRYSMGYKAKKGYTFWEKDFDGMAFKTMLRQLISKWGIMSLELQTAVERDETVSYQDGSSQYIGADEIPAIAEAIQGEVEEMETDAPEVDPGTGEVLSLADVQ